MKRYFRFYVSRLLVVLVSVCCLCVLDSCDKDEPDSPNTENPGNSQDPQKPDDNKDNDKMEIPSNLAGLTMYWWGLPGCESSESPESHPGFVRFVSGTGCNWGNGITGDNYSYTVQSENSAYLYFTITQDYPSIGVYRVITYSITLTFTDSHHFTFKGVKKINGSTYSLYCEGYFADTEY